MSHGFAHLRIALSTKINLYNNIFFYKLVDILKTENFRVDDDDDTIAYCCQCSGKGQWYI